MERQYSVGDRKCIFNCDILVDFALCILNIRSRLPNGVVCPLLGIPCIICMVTSQLHPMIRHYIFSYLLTFTSALPAVVVDAITSKVLNNLIAI